MIKRRDGLGLIAGALTLSNCPGLRAQARAPQRLNLEAFARRPLMEQVALSPDGLRLAAIVNSDDGSALITRDVSGGAIRTVITTDNLDSNFNWFRWVNNDRIVLSLRFPSRREVGYVQTVTTMERRILAINADGSNVISLLKDRGAASRNLKWAVNQDRVVDWLPEDGKHVLLALPASERDFDYAIYKVDIYTAERTHYSDSRRDVYAWITDHTHRARVGIGYNEKSETLVWACNPDGANWRLIKQSGPFSASSYHPLGFGLDPNLLYVRAKHEGLDAVFILDLRDPSMPLELKLAHPRFDLDGNLVHDERGEAIGIGAGLSGDSGAFYWNGRYKAQLQILDEILPDRFNTIYSAARSGERQIIHTSERGQPAAFYLAQLGATPSLKLLARSYPELHGKVIAKKSPTEFKARDGLILPAFLTLPPGSDENPAGKLVVFPHGGPQSADGPEFDPWASFMADRGWAVLQVNFRGSTGFGQRHMEAGLRRWGLEMQEDLEDGVAECVKRGIADPSRVAIAGASYGGYAALMGLIKTPDLYRGAFAFAPVTDLLDLAEDDGRFSQREAMRKQLGDANDDKQRLLATSPRFLADKIKAPVVIVHGTLDRQADYRHSLWMAEALKARGKAHKFISLEGGDHQLSHQPHRIQLFKELEAFLDQVLMPQARA